jgi:hypothetical protein
MSLYSIALFTHIVGAVLLFVVLTVEGLGLRFGFSAAPLNRVAGPISLVAILVPGFYMMASSWGWTGWIVTGITTYAVIAAVGAFTGIRVMQQRMSNGAATISWLARVGMATGVLFDMTLKPNLVVSVAVVLVAAAVGAGVALIGRREELRAA